MNERELNSIESREKIIKASLEEFAENGYKAASTNSICKKAKISKGLLYHYYPSKKELYLSILKLGIDNFKKSVKIQKIYSKKGIEYISDYFNDKFKFFSDNSLYYKVLVNAFFNPCMKEEEELAKHFNDYNNTLIYEVLKSIDINSKFEKEKVFELIVIIGEKLEEKHLQNIGKEEDCEVIEEFRKDHKLMIEIVFEGIDK